MKRIDIGTCVSGDMTESLIPQLLGLGYECFSINFHMSLGGIMLEDLATQVKELLSSSNAYVATLGLYCNPLQYDEHVKELEYVIDSAKHFGANMVSTFAGGLEGRSVEECMPAYKKVFGELAKKAEAQNVTIAIENCNMGGDWYKVTDNIAFNPKAWEMMFNEVDSPNIGLEWEPGHQMVQLIDPIPQLKEWAKKVVHLHGKDANVSMYDVSKYGILGAERFAQQRTPGFGDLDWRQVFTILYQNGYEGSICVEGFHDPIYKGELEIAGQKHAYDYLKWCRGGV